MTTDRTTEQSPESDVPEIEIRDPGVEEESGGYSQGLLVPLVVVPAMIVMLGVLIVTLFGLVSGSERTPEDNLNVVLNGGVNERQQAAFELVRQILEFQHAKAEGREPEWSVDPDMVERMRRARAEAPAPARPEDVWEPFVLSSMLAQLGEPEGARQLAELTQLDDALDPDLTVRMNAIFVLGSIGRELDPGTRDAVAATLIERIDGEDEGLALLVAGALQNLPGAASVAALESMLERSRLDIRLQAALSLAELGEVSGAPVLAALIEEAPYKEEREGDPNRWAPQTISASRLKALAALELLGRAPEPAVLRRLADEDGDPNVRSAALGLLENSGPESGS